MLQHFVDSLEVASLVADLVTKVLAIPLEVGLPAWVAVPLEAVLVA